MIDEIKEEAGGAELAASGAAAQNKLIYESNRKHSDPTQIGKRGSLCEPELGSLAAELLGSSELFEGKRYAVHDGRGYCAQEHSPGRWHGYPIGWQEVPPKLVRQLIQNGKLRNHDRKKYWETH